MAFDSASVSTLALPAAGALGVYALYKAYGAFFRASPLDVLPGPPSGSWLWGRWRELIEDHDGELQQAWIAEYGPVSAHKTLLGRTALLTTDLRAIQHILQHGDTFQKSAFTRRLLGRSLGWGVLVAEGAQHRAQRRVLNPAFGPAQVRELSGVFLDKSNELRDLWLSKLSPATGTAQLNAVAGISAATLDIIGLAGFGYAFDALARPADDPNELSAAFAEMIGNPGSPLTLALLGVLPGIPWLPTGAEAARRRSRAIMDRIGRALIAERKAEASASGKADTGGRDLLSLLVRANMSENAAQRLSDDEVLAQIPTFILAGHETTSTAVTWTLFQLAQRPALQAELRAELRALPLSPAASGNAPLDADTLAALDKLPLLDVVVRETLRANAPVQNAGRVATEDASIPLARPFVGTDGVPRDEVQVRKGDMIVLPILSVHRDEALWGADAREWKPERWLAGGAPESAHAVPGLWSHLLSFLGGAHSCIGYRFSLLETKVLLHALLAGLQFELAVPAAEIAKKAGVVTRPVLASAREQGIQLPVVISRAPEE